MAKACRGLVTFCPPEDLSWPPLNSRITVATFFSALVAFFIGPPRGFDFHCATQQAAVTSLQLVVNWVVDYHWHGLSRLCRMPVLLCLVKLGWQGQLKPPLLPPNL